jgi:hypothetical protein
MSFLGSLSFEDLDLLRKVVKNIHMRHFPEDLVTDHEADKVIEAFGDETCERLVRTAVDAGIRAL